MKEFCESKFFKKDQEYDLDFKADKFWGENMNQPFPDVIENVDKELNRWKVEYDALGHKKESSKVYFLL